jgi:UV excision repair protein RAD23
MKLTIKSLKQVPYEIEVENDSISIKDLKIQFEKVHGFDHSSLKLVFNGVILDDAKKLSDYNMKEGNVIVMMNIKVQPKKKEEAKVEEKVPEVKPASVPVTQPTTTTTTTQQQQPKPATTTTTTAPKKEEKDYTPQVKELMDMGFPKSESEAAVKAARGDLSLAVEFLTNGIPEHLLSQGESGNVNAEANPSTPNAVLKNISSIVKVLCYNNPSQLQNILFTLQQSSPELIELIKENEDEFKTMIQQPITEEDIRAFNEFNRQAGLGGAGAEGELGGAGASAGAEGEVFQQGGRNYIKLSKQDYDAVNKLKELGFSETDALQAYFACDKNEEMAANLLWENKLREQEQEQEFYIDCKFINVLKDFYNRFSNRWRTIWK